MHANSPATNTPKVIIVGAGFAGLSSALTLTQSDQAHRPLILEASNRVGGRAQTLPLSDTLSAEMGATWIHGIGTPEEPNPILAAAVEAGLIPSSPTQQRWWNSRFLLQNNKHELTKEEQVVVHRAVTAYAAAVEDDIEEAFGEGGLGGGSGIEESKGAVVGDFVDSAWVWLQKQLEDESIASGTAELKKKADVELAAAVWDWREKLQRAIDGCHSTHELNAAARSAYSEFGQTEVHAPVPCGYQAVAEALASRLGDSLLLNHHVSKINWGSEGVQIECTNGACFTADAAIATASLGFLKANHAAVFSPKLPESKVEVIEKKMEIGVVDKIIIDFCVERIEEEEDRYGNNAEKEEEDSNVGNTFAEPDQRVATYALLWDQSTTDEDLDLPEWARGIFSIRFGGPEFKRKNIEKSAVAVVNAEQQNPPQTIKTYTSAEKDAVEEQEEDEDDAAPPPGPPKYSQAVIWLTGDAAVQMEASSDSTVLSTIKKVVEMFPGIELPAGTSWDKAQLYRSCWGTDHLSLGSYSYVGKKARPGDVAILAEPVMVESEGRTKPVLLFAGEACHLQYIGTTHGAWLTGKQAAETVLRYYEEVESKKI